MPVEPLPPEKLRRACDPNRLPFESTAELESVNSIIGQPRGTRAIDFGIGIQSQGYNIFVLGESGTGRATTIRYFLEERTRKQTTPDDWVYVNNFTIAHQPRAIELPAGEGIKFRRRMSDLIDNLKTDLPKAFDTEAYRDTIDEMTRALEEQQDERLRKLQQQAAVAGFAVIRTASGLAIAPVDDGKVMSAEQFARLPVEAQQRLHEGQARMEDALGLVLEELRELERQTKQKIEGLNRHVAETAVEHHFRRFKEAYDDLEEVQLYLEEVHQDVLNRLEDFAPDDETEREIDWRRYEVNLLVDNRETEGAPVIVEDNPTYYNLMGSIEYEMQFGALTTHFTNIKAGSLHRANGGYLVIHMQDLLPHPNAWEALKRALKCRKIVLDTPDGRQMATKSLDPEPIPLQVKIILLGSPDIYYTLYERDEAFSELFKVKADFDSIMPRDEEHEYQYALFIANRCREEKLLHFDRTAVAKVVEYGSWLSDHQKRLSTRFSEVADIIRESSYWAGCNGHKVVTAADVQQALAERIERSNRIEERLREEIQEGTLFILTEGAVVGQVNGLSVLEIGDYAFGQPGRITARTYMGENGVVNIEREVDMAGPIHNKGLLTLNGYLGGKYARHQPLSLSASLTFEQNYNEIDGDSAASAELLALISSLSNIPIKQGIAVTGSVNQRGELQPIGGVVEKIEGFFAVCRTLGLTGEQGVMIPAANASNLMLSEEVVAAVADGKFHIWPIRTVDEAIELLTGQPAGEADEDGFYPEGTVHNAVQARLLTLAKELKSFGDHDQDVDEEEEESDKKE